MIINTDEWDTIKEFADRIGKIPQAVRHYVRKKQVEAINCKGLLLIKKTSADTLVIGKQGKRRKQL